MKPDAADLSERQRARWPALVHDLAAVGGGADADLNLLLDALRAEDRLQQVRDVLRLEGLTTPGSAGQPRAHPLLQVESALRRDIGSAFERLRLAPSKRPIGVRVTRSGTLAADD